MRLFRVSLFAIIIVLLSAGCTIPLLTPEASTTRPSSTPIPSTVTPESLASLTTSGPYLIYRKQRNNQQMLVILDADGKGRKLLTLPKAAQVGNLANVISADGKWLAYYTGSLGESFTTDSQGPADLALHMMDLDNGQSYLLTRLLSPDFPANFRKAATSLTQQGVTLVKGIDPAVLLGDAFAGGIESLAWSPDGRYLAFAGQMDGLSSDLYLYHTKTKTITRLSDGPEQIQSISWSPDGAWILHGSANLVGAGAEIHYHAAATDGSTMKTLLSSSIIGTWDWLNSHTYLQSDGTNGAGNFNLRSIDIETGAIKTLWKDFFVSFAVDPEQHLLAISGSETAGEAAALYLIDWETGSQRRVKEAIQKVEFLGLRQARFLATDANTNQTFFVQADGSSVATGFTTTLKQALPKLQYWVAFNNKLQVYSWQNRLLREIELPHPAREIDKLIWRPDSLGIFCLFDSELIAVNLVEGNIALVDADAPQSWLLDATWVGGQ